MEWKEKLLEPLPVDLLLLQVLWFLQLYSLLSWWAFSKAQDVKGLPMLPPLTTIKEEIG
jgi:hypothetical protein